MFHLRISHTILILIAVILEGTLAYISRSVWDTMYRSSCHLMIVSLTPCPCTVLTGRATTCVRRSSGHLGRPIRGAITAARGRVVAAASNVASAQLLHPPLRDTRCSRDILQHLTDLLKPVMQTTSRWPDMLAVMKIAAATQSVCQTL